MLFIHNHQLKLRSMVMWTYSDSQCMGVVQQRLLEKYRFAR